MGSVGRTRRKRSKGKRRTKSARTRSARTRSTKKVARRRKTSKRKASSAKKPRAGSKKKKSRTGSRKRTTKSKARSKSRRRSKSRPRSKSKPRSARRRKGVKRRASSSRKHSSKRAAKRKRVASKTRSRSRKAKKATSQKALKVSKPSEAKREAPSKPKPKTAPPMSPKHKLGSPHRRRSSLLLSTKSRRRSISAYQCPQTPVVMTKKERRRRRLTRTGLDTGRMKPKKEKCFTSGPLEITSYTYGTLYLKFLNEFLPKLNADLGPATKHVDLRAFPPMATIFTPEDDEMIVCKRPTKAMLKTAQTVVLEEIERQHKQSLRPGRISAIERMFYLATNEKDLTVDWDMMKNLVRKARVSKFTGEDTHDMGFMDPNTNSIRINSNFPKTAYEMKVTLMHEAMHNTVKRCGRPGNPEISETTEHLAMALCGDPDEFTNLISELDFDDPPPDMDSEYEDGDCDPEQPSAREQTDSTKLYYDKTVRTIERLGFSQDDIVQHRVVCSPPLQRHIQTRNTADEPPRLKRAHTV